MANFAQKVAAHRVGKDELAVFYVGQAGYLIKTHDGKLIGLDMYLTDCVERLAISAASAPRFWRPMN